MRNFSNKYNEVIDSYWSMIRKSAEKSKYVYVYGAGHFAHVLQKRLNEMSIKIEGFVVTDTRENISSISGIPVTDIDSVDSESETTLFVIGANCNYTDEITEILNLHGYTNIISAPFELMYCLDEEELYSRPAIEVTTKIGCSRRCKYCPQDILIKNYFSESSTAYMSLNDFKIFIDKTPHNCNIAFGGYCEPFLNPMAIDMIEYAAKKRRVYVFTTFVNVNEDILSRLEKSGIEYITAHFPDSKAYADIPITKEYLKTIEKAMKIIKSDGSPIIRYATSQAKPASEILELIKGRLKVSWTLNDRAGNLAESEDLISTRSLTGELYCKNALGANHFVLLPNGDMSFCANDFGLKHIVGNLLKQSWDEIINGNAFELIKDRMDDENKGYVLCRDCAYAKTL